MKRLWCGFLLPLDSAGMNVIGQAVSTIWHLAYLHQMAAFQKGPPECSSTPNGMLIQANKDDLTEISHCSYFLKYSSFLIMRPHEPSRSDHLSLTVHTALPMIYHDIPSPQSQFRASWENTNWKWDAEKSRARMKCTCPAFAEREISCVILIYCWFLRRNVVL